MDQTLRRVAVIGGVRIPFCRSNTFYADQSNLDMMTAVLNGLVEKYKLAGVHIDEAVGGAVVTHSRDWNLAREAVLGTKLAPTTPGITMQQACGTSLQAAMSIAAKIAIGQIESGIAMGSDTTSDAPIVFKPKFAHRLVQVQQGKSTADKLRALKGFSPTELAPQPPSVSEPRTGLSMGQHAELMAQEWKISRAEQDQLAFESHKKAAEAYLSGYMDDLVVPFAGVFRDNNLREDISLEKIATLKTAFDKSERGTLTAAQAAAAAGPTWSHGAAARRHGATNRPSPRTDAGSTRRCRRARRSRPSRAHRRSCRFGETAVHRISPAPRPVAAARGQHRHGPPLVGLRQPFDPLRERHAETRLAPLGNFSRQRRRRRLVDDRTPPAPGHRLAVRQADEQRGRRPRPTT